MSDSGAARSETRLGPYRLREPLRRRGRLVTFAAEHEQLARPVWITTVDASDRMIPALAERLEHEARLLAKLDGSALPMLIELREFERGAALVTSAVEGPTLDRLAEALGNRRLSWQDLSGLALGMARALAPLHALGIAHLELAPDSFVLTPSGRVVLASIGRGFELDTASSEPSGEELLSPRHEPYRSPEERTEERVDLAADVFALGLVIGELALGHHPYAGPEGAESIGRRVRRGDVARLSIPELPREIGRVLEMAIEPSASLRSSSARVLERELAAAIGAPDDDARAVRALLATAGLTTTTVERPAARSQPWGLLLRRHALRVGVALAAAISGGSLALALREPSVEPASTRTNALSTGSVRVLARPWAEVWIDGRMMDTTPVGMPIPLPVGVHEIVLRHPAAAEERRRIELREGAVLTIDVDMRVVRPAASAPDASP